MTLWICRVTECQEMIIDLRYATNENFVGRPVKGYENRKCWMTLLGRR